MEEVEWEGPPLWRCGDVGVADDGVHCVVVAPGEARWGGVLCVSGRYGACLTESTEIFVSGRDVCGGGECTLFAED